MTRTQLTVDINSTFHLPDKHNQKSHGNWKRTESELLLNRGRRFRVIRDYVDDSGSRTLDVEVIN